MKIIQILVAPEDPTYQGCLLGLGDDGFVYVCRKGGVEWEVYLTPPEDSGTVPCTAI